MNPPRPQYTVSVNAVTCLTNRGAQEQPKKKKNEYKMSCSSIHSAY